MKTKLKFAFFVLSVLYFVWVLLPPCVAASTSINWYSYDEGMANGRIEKKKIFINFYAAWCRYCGKMDNETFKNPSVIEYLNDHFISIKVDTDKEQKIAYKYSVRGLPASWFIAEDGEKIGSHPGFVPAAMLIHILRYIHTDSYQKMTFKDFLEVGQEEVLQ